MNYIEFFFFICLMLKCISHWANSPDNDSPPTLDKAWNLLEQAFRCNYDNYRIYLINQAKIILEQNFGPDPNEIAIRLNNLALRYNDQSRYAEARLIKNGAKAILGISLESEHPDAADTPNEIVLNSDYIGSFTDIDNSMLSFGDQGLHDAPTPLNIKSYTFEEIFGSKHYRLTEYLQKVLLIISISYTKKNDLIDNALYATRKLLKLNDPSFIYSLDLLSMLLSNDGYYAEALPLCKLVLKEKENILGLEHPDLVEYMNNLAFLYHQLGFYPKAAQLYINILFSLEKISGYEIQETIKYIDHLSELAIQGQYADAVFICAKSLSIKEKILGSNHADLKYNHLLMARALAANSFSKLSFEHAKLAIDIHLEHMGIALSGVDTPERKSYIQESQHQFFFIYLSLAFKQLTTDIQIPRAVLQSILYSKQILTLLLTTERKLLLSGIYPDLEVDINRHREISMQIAEMSLKTPNKKENIHVVLKFHHMMDDLKRELSELERTLSRHVPEIRLEHLRGKATAETVAAALPPGSALVEYVKYRRYDFQAVKAKGEENWQEWRYLALVLPQGQPDAVRLIDLGEAAVIDHDIEAYLQGMESLTPSVSGNTSFHSDRMVPEDQVDDDVPANPNLHEAGIRLRQRLLDSLWADDDFAFAGNVGKPQLVIAADGELSRLPFEALPLDAQGEYLLDQYDIRYVGSGRDLITLPEENRRKPGPPLVLADPDFDWQGPEGIGVVRQEPGPEFPVDSILSSLKQKSPYSLHQSRDLDNNHFRFSRLPGTRIEAELVGGYLNVTPWLDKEALEGKLKQQPSPAILHIATHGFFYPNQPMETEDWPLLRDGPSSFRRHLSKLENPLLRSGLALAGAHHALKAKEHTDPDTEDGLLTAADVAEMNLLDTELVVLSACQTGLGDIEIGQGVMGLRTAFQVAGAKALVMSLWPVDDLATCILMEQFYANLTQRRQPHGDALAEAKHYLRYLTISDLRPVWLTPDMKDRFAEADSKYAAHFDRLNNLPDGTQPFLKPYYWAAFILVGETGKLPETALTN